MRFIVFWLFLWGACIAWADCPVADKIAREKKLSEAMSLYFQCALQNNDDETQLYLARIYGKGQGDVAKNTQRTLLFYHLSSENGNAAAMVELATLLRSLDDSDESRQEIITYSRKIAAQAKKTIGGSFDGKLLHPYALLVLAAEKPEAKWFYTTKTKTDPRATELLKNYKVDPDKKKVLMQTATAWKQRKMKDMAANALTLKELNEFYKTLYPKKGLPNNFARSQAVNKLKERVENIQK